MQCANHFSATGNRCPEQATHECTDDADPSWKSFRCSEHATEHLGPLDRDGNPLMNSRHAQLIEALSATRRVQVVDQG